MRYVVIMKNNIFWLTEKYIMIDDIKTKESTKFLKAGCLVTMYYASWQGLVARITKCNM